MYFSILLLQTFFQIIWGFSKGCQKHRKGGQNPDQKKKQRKRQGASATDTVKKIVSEVQNIGLQGVAMWNLNSHCVVPTTPQNKVNRDPLDRLNMLGNKGSYLDFPKFLRRRPFKMSNFLSYFLTPPTPKSINIP